MIREPKNNNSMSKVMSETLEDGAMDIFQRLADISFELYGLVTFVYKGKEYVFSNQQQLTEFLVKD
jgi:hypothetical protein